MRALTLWPILLSASALAASLLAGCESTKRLLAGMDKPGIQITGVRPDNLSATGVLLNFDAEVTNPYDLPLPLTDIAYTLASGGPAFIDGTAKIGGVIPAKGKKTVTLPVGLRFAPLMERVAAAKPGALVPYEALLTFKVDAPGVGPLELPVKKTGELPIPAMPEVTITSVKWDQLGLTGAKGEVRLKVKNTNQFPVDLNQLGYALTLGGRDVASSRVADATKFAAGAEQEIRVPISISASQAGLGLFDIIRGNGSAYSIKGDAALGTPMGPLTLPFERKGETKFLR